MSTHVLFVAPYFGANMLRCLNAFAALDDVRLGVVSHEPEERIPEPLRPRLAGHFRIPNTLDAGQLVVAGRAFQREWGHVDRLVGYLEQLQLPLAEARDALGIAGMSAETARNFRDKNRMKSVLAQAGLPVARQARITSAEHARRFVAQVGYPIVLKPLAGVGTRDTLRVGSERELHGALNRLLPGPNRPAQAEQFIQGAEHTFETVVIDGEPVWSSSTYYLPGPLQVLENPWMRYCVLLPREEDPPHVAAFRDLNARAVKALGLRTGLTHMEWFLQPDGTPVISEVAARPPGVNIMAIVSAAHGGDAWEQWARLMATGSWNLPPRAWAAGSAFFRGQGPGRMVAAVEGLDAALADLGDTVTRASLPKVGQPRASGYEGEGWAIVRHETTDGAVAALRRLVTDTRITYR